MQGCMWILTRYNKQFLSLLFPIWNNKREAVSHFLTFITSPWKLIFSAYFLGKKKILYASVAFQNDTTSLVFAGQQHLLSFFSEKPHLELAFLLPSPSLPSTPERFLIEAEKSPNPSGVQWSHKFRSQQASERKQPGRVRNKKSTLRSHHS